MGLPVCNSQPFVGTQQFEIPFGTTITSVNRIVKPPGFAWQLIVCARPIVPLWGVTLNATSGAYDFVTSTQANRQTLIAIAQSVFEASKNYTNDIITGDTQYMPDFAESRDFGAYTNARIGSSTCLQNRYIETYNKAVQFFALHGAIAAFDFTVYNELTELTKKVMSESDKQMFIMPGVWEFRVGSAAYTALEAWRTADETFQKLYSLEAITT